MHTRRFERDAAFDSFSMFFLKDPLPLVFCLLFFFGFQLCFWVFPPTLFPSDIKKNKACSLVSTDSFVVCPARSNTRSLSVAKPRAKASPPMQQQTPALHRHRSPRGVNSPHHACVHNAHHVLRACPLTDFSAGLLLLLLLQCRCFC